MNSSKAQYELDAVNLFRSSDTAVLSTLSKSSDSYPFGSFVTFASNGNRELIVYASDIAEHTKNVLNDSRACATIFSAAHKGDKQTSARLSLMGDLTRVDDNQARSYQTRFLKFLPESEGYSRMHGFNFYKLATIKARWIGGFGQIGWLDTTHWTAATPPWQKNESPMIEHMNDDHRNVLCSTLNAKFNIADPKAEMLALCTDGYYIMSAGNRYFIAFDEPCYSESAIRAALVQQANAYRSFEL